MSQYFRWHGFADAEAVAAEAVQRILVAAGEAIAARGWFRIVLAGGSTPQKAYQQLAGCQSDWARWHVYLGDERCLPREHPERNSRMIGAAWLDRGQIPVQHIHWIPAELGPEQAAVAYEGLVRDALPFDLVLLGMGEDGHTASLFPGHWHQPDRLVVPVLDAPKPPPARVSLNYAALDNSRSLLLLVTGAAKRPMVKAWREGASLPVSRLQCPTGVDVLLDEAAGGGLGV